MPFFNQSIRTRADLDLPFFGGIDRARCHVGHVVWLRKYSDKLARKFSEAGLGNKAGGHPAIIVGLSPDHDQVTISLVSRS